MSAEKITARQFLIEYAERSKLTPERLFEEGLVVATCTHCPYRGCEGWQMTTPKVIEAFGREETVVLTAENWSADE